MADDLAEKAQGSSLDLAGLNPHQIEFIKYLIEKGKLKIEGADGNEKYIPQNPESTLPLLDEIQAHLNEVRLAKTSANISAPEIQIEILKTMQTLYQQVAKKIKDDPRAIAGGPPPSVYQVVVVRDRKRSADGSVQALRLFWDARDKAVEGKYDKIFYDTQGGPAARSTSEFHIEEDGSLLIEATRRDYGSKEDFGYRDEIDLHQITPAETFVGKSTPQAIEEVESALGLYLNPLATPQTK